MPTQQPPPVNKAQKLVQQIQLLEENVNQKLDRLDKIDVGMIALAKEVKQPNITKQKQDEIVRQIQRLDIQRKETQKGLVNDMNNLTALEKVHNNYNYAFACKKFTEIGASLKDELILIQKASEFAERINQHTEALDADV